MKKILTLAGWVLVYSVASAQLNRYDGYYYNSTPGIPVTGVPQDGKDAVAVGNSLFAVGIERASTTVKEGKVFLTEHDLLLGAPLGTPYDLNITANDVKILKTLDGNLLIAALYRNIPFSRDEITVRSRDGQSPAASG